MKKSKIENQWYLLPLQKCKLSFHLLHGGSPRLWLEVSALLLQAPSHSDDGFDGLHGQWGERDLPDTEQVINELSAEKSYGRGAACGKPVRRDKDVGISSESSGYNQKLKLRNPALNSPKKTAFYVRGPWNWEAGRATTECSYHIPMQMGCPEPPWSDNSKII